MRCGCWIGEKQKNTLQGETVIIDESDAKRNEFNRIPNEIRCLQNSVRVKLSFLCLHKTAAFVSSNDDIGIRRTWNRGNS